MEAVASAQALFGGLYFGAMVLDRKRATTSIGIMRKRQSDLSFVIDDDQYQNAPSQNMSRITFIIFITSIVLTAVSAEAAGPALIEFEVDRVKYAGRVETRTTSQCWLMDRTGKLTELELAKIRNVKLVSSRFLPLTSTMLSSKLKREFGETAGSAEYSSLLSGSTAGQSERLRSVVRGNLSVVLHALFDSRLQGAKS